MNPYLAYERKMARKYRMQAIKKACGWCLFGAGIVVFILLSAYYSMTIDFEFPDRNKFKNAYKTVHVIRFESTICWDCHKP